MTGVAIEFEVHHDAVDPFAVGLEFIEAEFVFHDEEDDEGGADADGETEYVDGGEEFIPPNAAEGDGKMVAEHEQGYGLVWR